MIYNTGMKKITTREFSRYFGKHRLSDVDVTSNGKIVGEWRLKEEDVGQEKPKKVKEEKFKTMFKDKKLNK